MCACAAHPRSGLAPMMPTRIFGAPLLLMFASPSAQLLQRSAPGDHLIEPGSDPHHGQVPENLWTGTHDAFRLRHDRERGDMTARSFRVPDRIPYVTAA